MHLNGLLMLVLLVQRRFRGKKLHNSVGKLPGFGPQFPHSAEKEVIKDLIDRGNVFKVLDTKPS